MYFEQLHESFNSRKSKSKESEEKDYSDITNKTLSKWLKLSTDADLGFAYLDLISKVILWRTSHREPTISYVAAVPFRNDPKPEYIVDLLKKKAQLKFLSETRLSNPEKCVWHFQILCGNAAEQLPNKFLLEGNTFEKLAQVATLFDRTSTLTSGVGEHK